jgi:hypothetical protein
MPNISEFKNNQKSKKSSAAELKTAGHDQKKQASVTRRPGRTTVEKTRIKVVEVDSMVGSDENKNGTKSAETIQETADHTDKIEINFPGSEVLRANFPKGFKTAEAVVTDWVNDGKFEDLPGVTNPLAKAAVQQGLIKAKKLEKKVMESPVTEKVTMQAVTYAMKAQALVKEIRDKVKSHTGK